MLDSRQRELMERFKAERGYWSPFWEQLLEWDPAFFENYINFSGHMFKKGPLAIKIKELILIAIDAATTHLYEPGVRVHIRNALNAGATREEILEVLELVSVLGIHSCTMGVPVLAEEIRKLEAERGKSP